MSGMIRRAAAGNALRNAHDGGAATAVAMAAARPGIGAFNPHESTAIAGLCGGADDADRPQSGNSAIATCGFPHVAFGRAVQTPRICADWGGMAAGLLVKPHQG
jgi:hypothetical protein